MLERQHEYIVPYDLTRRFARNLSGLAQQQSDNQTRQPANGRTTKTTRVSETNQPKQWVLTLRITCALAGAKRRGGRPVNVPCYVAIDQSTIYVKQESRLARTGLCEDGSLWRDYGGEPVRPPWSGRAPHCLCTPRRRGVSFDLQHPSGVLL